MCQSWVFGLCGPWIGAPNSKHISFENESGFFLEHWNNLVHPKPSLMVLWAPLTFPLLSKIMNMKTFRVSESDS